MTSSTPHSTPATRREAAAPLWLRIILWIGVATTVVSFLATVVVIVLYFFSVQIPSWLFFIALFVFPVGFMLILVYLAGMALIRRSRTKKYARQNA